MPANRLASLKYSGVKDEVVFGCQKEKRARSRAYKAKKGAGQSIMVISPDKEMLSDICSLLLINNFNNVISHPLDFFALQDDSILRGAATVIIDIGSCNDVTLICETSHVADPCQRASGLSRPQ